VAIQPGGGMWTDSSDARIKNVLGNYDHGLAEILQLNPVRYTFKGNDSQFPTPEPQEEGDTRLPQQTPHGAVVGKEFIGIVAQDVEGVLPETITLREAYIDNQKVTDLREFNGSALTYALINAVKELSAANDALVARVAALEGAP